MVFKEVFSEIGEADDDRFGYSVSASGDYLAIGAHLNDEAGSGAGKIYLYERKSDGWKLVFTALGEAANDNFGQSVSINGNYLTVGAYANDEGPGDNAGKVYLYERKRDGKWELVFTELGEVGSEQFGWSVSISGNYLAVGAYLNDEAGSGAGKIYLYERKEGKWELVFTKLGEAASDNFGYSVSIGGNYLAVGAYANNEGPGADDAGKVYIYERKKNGWELVFTALGEAANDLFGRNISVSGNYLAVGANRNNEGPGNNDAGKVYLYERKSDGWKLVFTALGEAADDEFGFSVSVSGNYLAVGANFNDEGPGNSAGKVYLYERKSSGWELIFTALGEVDSDQFGQNVSVSGNYLAAGAHFNDEGPGNSAGKVYLYSNQD